MNKEDLKLHKKPWVTLKIQKLIKYRDKLLRKLDRKFTEAGEYLYKKFSRMNYHNNQFTKYESNMKMLWSGIYYQHKGEKVCNIFRLVQNREAVKDAYEIAKIFNNYSVNIAGKIDSEMSRTKKSPLDNLGKSWICPFLFLLQILLKLKPLYLN